MAPPAPRAPPALRDVPGAERLVLVVIFAVTGSASAFLSRRFWAAVLATGVLDFCGVPETASLWGGPWLFRVLYLLTMSPLYSVLLFSIGTAAGRRGFYGPFVAKMWRRLLPRSASQVLDGILIPADPHVE